LTVITLAKKNSLFKCASPYFDILVRNLLNESEFLS
jgi:hypothetical protein